MTKTIPWVAALSLSIASCRTSAPVELDAPDEALMVAVLGASDAKSAPFTSWEPGESLPVFVDASSEQWLVAYRPSQLEVFRAIDDPIWSSKVVRRAKACDPRLPRPAWSARWDIDERTWVSVSPDELPELTHVALDEICPEDPPRAIDLDCEPEYCKFDPVRVEGQRCVYRASVSICGFDGQSLEIRVLHDGSACVQTLVDDDPTSARSCMAAPTVPGASSSHTCSFPEACGLHLYSGPVPDAPFTLERLALLGSAKSYLPWGYGQEPGFTADRLLDGHAYDFVQLGDRVLVSVPDEPGQSCQVDPATGLDPRSGRIMHVDAARLTVVDSSTAPDCLVRMVAHADEASGFYATFADLSIRDFELGDFDSSGRLVRRRSLGLPIPDDLPPDQAPTRFRSPSALELYGDPPELGLLDSYIFTDRPKLGTSLQIIGTDDLETRARIDYDIEQGAHLTPLSNDSMLVTFHQLARFDWIDWNDARIEDSRDYERSLWRLFGASLYHPRSAKLLLSADSDLRSIDGRNWNTLAQRPLYERLATVVLIAPWPADDRLALVFFVSDRGEPETVAYAALFDTESDRFLPGIWPLGHGIVNHVEVDAAGRLLLLLPWSAELLRLTPR